MGEQHRSADWERVRSLFGRALDQPAAERDAWLAGAAGDDPELLAEVRSLLGYEASQLDRTTPPSGPAAEARERAAAGAAAPPDGAAARRAGSAAVAGHPAEVGPYRILALLGEGGMGAVYEAEQSNPHRRVALKVIRTALATDEMRRRFQLEGEVLGRLRHAAIAQVYETGTARLAEGVDVPYLAMEHVVGATTLIEHVHAHVPALDDRLQLFARLVDGIEHAHQNGIVHRDLKPANVLVDADGNPKIIDFGLARAVDEDSDLMSMHTRTGQLMGTPLYMSPEQFTGTHRAVGVTSDVYSLGVILFELVTGELPHELRGLDVLEMARVVRDHPPRTLSQSGTRVRDDLDTIVAKALEKLPERRYENAAAFAADVRRYLRHEPVLARPASAFYQARLFARRHRALVVSVGLVLVVAITAAIVSFGFAVDARREAQQSERLAYRAAILSASEAVDAERAAAARELLASTPEARRGWEYRHLTARLATWLSAPFPEGVRVVRGAFSADRGTFLADESFDGGRRWRVWDAASWRPGFELPMEILFEQLAFPRAALSPDGARLLTVGFGALHVDQYDVATGARVARFDVARPAPADSMLPEIAHVGWFPDGVRFWVTHPSTELSVWDASTGECLRSFSETARACVSPDGRWMVLVQDRRYVLIDARSLEQRPGELPVQTVTNGVVTLAPAPRGAVFAAGIHDGSIDLLRVVDGEFELLRKLPETVGLVSSLIFSPDGKRLAATGAAQRLVVWDVDQDARVLDIQLESSADGLAYLPESGDLMVTGNEFPPRVLPVGSGDPSVLRGHASYVYPARFTPDGGTLVSGGWDGTFGEAGGLRLWDARSGRAVAAAGEPGVAYVDAAVLPGGRRLVTAELHGPEQRNGVLDLATGAWSTMTFPPDGSLAERVAPLPDGRRVLSTFRYGNTYLWDVETREILASVDQRTEQGRFPDGHGPVALSPDGRRVALGDRLTGIRVLRTDDLTPLRDWPAHEAPIWSLAYSPDGRWIVSTSEDETAAVWDAATGAQVARLTGHGADVLAVAVSPDGSRIATAGRDRTVLLWDTTHFDNVGQLRAHEKYVYSLAWSDDGETLVSASGDGTLRMWRTATLEEQLAEGAAREAALPALERRFARLATEHREPSALHAALLEDPALTPRERELLRQVQWAHALRRRPGVAQVDGQRNAPASAWYRAPRASTPPRVDGALDDAAWEQAPWTALDVDIEGASKPAPAHATRVRMLWDDEFLYVAAKLDEPHVWATLTEHDSIVYRDNDFEVFLDPEGDGRWYGEVEINARGTVFDLALDKPYNRGGHAHIDWTPPALRSAVRVQGTLDDPRDVDSGWTLELAIPHAAFAEHAGVPLPPRAGDVWRLNFSRVQWQHDVVDGAYVKREGVREDNWVWSPQFAINMHLPEHWGRLEFVDGDD